MQGSGGAIGTPVAVQVEVEYGLVSFNGTCSDWEILDLPTYICIDLTSRLLASLTANAKYRQAAYDFLGSESPPHYPVTREHISQQSNNALGNVYRDRWSED